jgi:hypothetical protein
MQIGIVVAIIGLGLLLTALTSDVSKTSEPGIRLIDGKPFLVEQAGEWSGGPMDGLTKEEREVLPKDTEGARRLYTNKAGNQLYCSIVLAGRDVTSIHRPELCLPGQGWKIQNQYIESISTGAGNSDKLVDVMRMDAVKAVALPSGQSVEARSIFAYWFIGKDRVTPHHWERIMWNAKDRVFFNTNHRWAYILIHTPLVGEMGPGVTYEQLGKQTMNVLSDFVRAIYPTLMPE